MMEDVQQRRVARLAGFHTAVQHALLRGDDEQGKEHSRDSGSGGRGIVAGYSSGDADAGAGSVDKEEQATNEALLEELNKLKLEEAEHERHIPHATDKGSSPELREKRVLARRILLLKSEVEALNKYPFTVLQRSVQAIRSQTTARVDASIHRLRLLRSELKTDIQRTAEELERQETCLQEYDGLHRGLVERREQAQEKLNALQAETSQESGTQAIKKVKRRAKAVRTWNKELLVSTQKFLDEHFPAPRPGDVAGRPVGTKTRKTIDSFFPRQSRRRSRGREDDEDEEDEGEEGSGGTSFISLKQLLQTLMNVCVARPHDPYITIDDDKHWLPYLEMLQRAGITQVHPRDQRKIKLTEFHV